MTVPDEVEELIAGAALSAHLATAVDDRPHVAPVWYTYDDGTLSTITGGKKLENARRNPRVAVSIERYDREGVDWAVQLLGTARVIEDRERYREVARGIDEKYDGPYAADGGEEGALLAIEVGSATCQRY